MLKCMKSHWKRAVSGLLAVIMAAGMLPISAFAADNSSKSCRVKEYVSEWKRREDEKKDSADKTPPAPAPEPAQEEQPLAQKETVNPAQDLEYNVEDAPKSSGVLGMIDMSGVRGDDGPDDEADSPPGR